MCKLSNFFKYWKVLKSIPEFVCWAESHMDLNIDLIRNYYQIPDLESGFSASLE